MLAIWNEVSSFLPPNRVPVSNPPQIGKIAPSSDRLPLPHNDAPVIVVFLRHVGCPFAEKTFLQLRMIAAAHPETHFVAVSHSSVQAMDRWVSALGGTGRVEVLVDPSRVLYGKWGLGLSGISANIGLTPLTEVAKLAYNEGIYNRAANGSRWQTGGAFGVDKEGIVRWVFVAANSSDVPNLGDAIEALKK